jgi:F0F1-type ATP synthase membrane subunit b/b'
LLVPLPEEAFALGGLILGACKFVYGPVRMRMKNREKNIESDREAGLEALM